jgi:hypothetical protein
MRVRFLLLLLCSAFSLALVACTGTSGDDDDDDSAPAGAPTWDADIQPMLANYCAPCHTAPGGGSGGLVWLDGHDNVTSDALNTIACPDGMSKGECIPGRIERNEMPEGADCVPGQPGCPTEAEFQMLQDWVDAGMPQ